MLGNYLITALRHLWRERGYAAINIFGLAVGLCLCLLVIQLAAHQLSVGDFHKEKNRVFRVIEKKDPRDWPADLGLRSATLPLPLGPTLKERSARSRGNSSLFLGFAAVQSWGKEWDSCERGSSDGIQCFRNVQLVSPAWRPQDRFVAPLHHGADRTIGPSALWRERSHWPGRPLQRSLRLRGHRHRRPAALQLTAPVLGTALPGNCEQGGPPGLA